MKITLYKELSNKKEIATVDAGQSVEKALPEIKFENAVIIVNGKKTEKKHILKESDIVTIRQLPGKDVKVEWDDIVFGILTGGIYNTVKGSVQAYKAKQAAQEAQEELEKVKKLTNSSIDNRPFLRGATNTVATGNSQPYICGRHLFTPYLLCNPFYKLSGADGKDEYTYTVLECGFNKQIIDTVSIDDIKIKKFSSATPQEGSYNLDGGQVFAEDGLLEISQDGGLLTALPELNYKTVSKACNDEIPRDSKVANGKADYLTYTLDPNAKTVDVAISFPYGLFAYNKNNDKIETSVTITPQYSLDGGSSWIDFTFDNNGTKTNTFKRNVSKTELRYCAHKEFSLSDYQTLKNHNQDCIIIRVRSNGNDDDRIKNDCYVLFYQSVCFDTNKSSYPAGIVEDNGAAGLVSCKIVEDRERAFCTILGLRVKASVNNEDKLKKINIITQGTARTWNGTQWSDEKTATRNPAAWALEILTSDSHPMSKYADSEIDLESFGDFYDYCEENYFYFDHVITTNTKKSTTLGAIMENCGAALYWDMYGRLAVAIDAPQENAIAVYNPQNIINITNKKTFGRRTDGLRVKYITAYNDLFTEETYLLMRDGKTLDQDSIIKDVTVTGITTYEHIVKYARRLMAIEALRPKTTTIEVGNEGVYFTPYSKILLQDDSLKIGLGSAVIQSTVWENRTLKRIVVNNYFTFEIGKHYGIIVNCYKNNKAIPLSLVVTGTGKTNTLEIQTTVLDRFAEKPEAGCVLSFGELDGAGEFEKITKPYLINNITRTDKGFNLELINYDEAIYGTGAIPRYKSNITSKAGSTKSEIPADTPTREEMTDVIDSATKEAVNELAELVTHGVRFSNIHKIKPITAESFERVANLDSLQQKLDEILQEGAFGLSLTKDELTIEIENKEKGLKTTIQQTTEQILAQAEDTKRELTAALAVQADAIQAMVEGGGTSGQLSLSLELPAMITTAQRNLFIQKSTAAKVNAVYARVQDTDYYSIKNGATDTQVYALWQDLKSAKLLASQIVLDADQILINGETIINNAKKIKAEMIDVQTLLGENAYFSGEVRSALSHFRDDLFTPMLEFKQVYNSGSNFTINMDSESVASIKAKFDAALSSPSAVNIDFENTSCKRLYIYIYETNYTEKDVIPYAKSAWYLQRRISDEYNDTVYEIAGVSAQLRQLIIGNQKVIDPYATKLTFNYIAEELGIDALNVYCANTLQAQNGYMFQSTPWRNGGGYSYNNTQDSFYKFLVKCGVGYTPRLCCIKTDAGYFLGVVRRTSITAYTVYSSMHSSISSAARPIIDDTTNVAYTLNSGDTSQVEIREIYF